jgi:hypothetical protein
MNLRLSKPRTRYERQRFTLCGALICCALALAPVWSISPVAAEPLLLEIAPATADFDEQTNEPIVTFQLTPDSALKLIELTHQNAGRPIDMRVDAKVLSRPFVMAFPNGVLISGHFSEQVARDLVARFSAGTKIEIEAVAN